MKPLRPVCRGTASNTDRESLCNVFRDGEQLGHGIERLCAIVLIEPGYDHPLSNIGHLVAHCDQVEIKKLSFINADNLRLRIKVYEYFGGSCNDLRLHFHVAVADNVILAETVIEPWLEDLKALLCNLRSPESTDQFLALSTEHTAADHFNRTEVVVRILK